MGVSGSVYPMEKEIRTDWMEVFLAMLLKKSEVMKLYDIYTNVDDDKNGSISVVKLLKLLNIERTEFTEGMFSSFDNDLKDKCDFYEFVVSVWKFCTLGTAALSKFLLVGQTICLPWLTYH